MFNLTKTELIISLLINNSFDFAKYNIMSGAEPNASNVFLFKIFLIIK